ncbi:MAG: sugar ABC transporter substrate-binding protein [Nitrososphaerales archaeon]
MVKLRALFTGGLAGKAYHTLYNKIEDFKLKYGIDVEIVDVLFYPDIYTKIEKEIIEGKKVEYDILSGHTSFIGSHGKYHLTLNEEFSEEELSDFMERVLNACKFNGNLLQIPRHVDVRILYYRTDLFNDPKEKEAFEKKFGYELKPPENWEMLKDIAIHFTRPPDLYGFSFVGKKHPLVGTFMELLAMCGGSLIDEEGNPSFNDEYGEQALQFLVDLYRKCKVTPPNTPDYLYEDVTRDFRKGRVAMVFDWPGVFGSLNNPKKSMVAEKFDFALYPKGPIGKRYVYGGAHTFALYKGTKNKEESLKLLKFLTSEESQYFEYKSEGFLPVRRSVWNRIVSEAEESRNLKEIKRLKIFRETIEKFYYPVKVKDWVKFYESVWPSLNKALRGELTVKEALKEAFNSVTK